MRAVRSNDPDTSLILVVLLLLAISLPIIYSASHVTWEFKKVLHQFFSILLALVAMAVVARIDYRAWARFRRVLFLLTSCALLITLLAKRIHGAQSWIDLGFFRLEPSELAKFALIMAFGATLARLREGIRTPRLFLHSIWVFVPPVLLVLAQPDMGTAVILCAIWLGMVAAAGARGWMIVVTVVSALLLFVLAWNIRLPGHKDTLVKTYQKQRLDIFHADKATGGYHQDQARIAIGSGKLWGKGYLQGTQAQRGFLPEQENDNDFIFAVIGEEEGLIGCFMLLSLYLFLLFRLLRIADEAETDFARLVTVGFTVMLAVHIFINIGMCLSLSPVTGVPLPFISYGGSNLLANLLCLGVILNISRSRQTRRQWAETAELVRL